MKKFLAISLCCLFHLNSYASEVPGDQVCADQGKLAVAAAAKTSSKNITFYNGALVGDGIDVVEIESFLAEGQQGIYVIGFNRDDCSVFFPAKLINN